MDIAPLMLPAREPTAHAFAAVTGGRAVKLRLGVNAADLDAALVGVPQVTPITVAGEKPYGIAERDRVAGAKVKIYRNGRIPIEAGAAIAHGVRVQLDNVGRVIPYVAGAGIEAIGWAVADAANGALAPIDLELGS